MTNAAVDKLNGEVLLLSLQNAKADKKLSIFLQVEDDLVENFSWTRLEYALNGLLNHYEVRDAKALLKMRL